jgi:membrane fusion protein
VPTVNAEPQHPLFRPEVAEARKQRVHGEIVLTQPVRTRMLVMLLALAVAIMAAWIVLGRYSRTEVAMGILVTDDASAKVLAIRPGQVTDLLVREGDVVRAGQRLAAIRVEQASESGGSEIGEGLAAIELQRGLADQQVHLSGARGASERSRLAATLAGLAQQRADLADQITIQSEVVASAEDTFERIQTVVEKGFISKLEVERRRQAWLAARQELGRLNQQVNAARADEAGTRAEIAGIAANTGSEVASARSSSQTLAQQRARLRGERAYVVTAPVAGRVTALQAAVGRTVDSGIPLMVIVPEGSKLHADVYAPSRAIGFVKPGQEVRLLYDAFPYQRFGSFTGRIARVSRTAMDPRELNVPLKIEEPVYRIEVTPGAQAVDAFGERLPLQPGMTLRANIVLDRRSFGEWLLQPLNAVLRRNE